ncbi:MAG: CoA transferase [Rhodospirillaceae bacterium]|jgi:crotonobetainyl-CoA:carnitine CoA-transferase CaiB-like acyl-CoA transferase|nr:CoA transferase [Rhodospirillaceae bacterium]MBT5666970.1 CoA transferase [Rhodospirillaceae bacterium]MBT5811759.1 CoA transferase [Rhodospirillaceae bacterium]
MGALDGIKVLDLSRVLAGPYCGQMLADNGASVIKVESPGGDLNRTFPHAIGGGQTSNWLSVNRGKRDITLNLKSPKALELLDALVAKMDVVIQSFLPDTAEKLGVGYDRLKALNPDLIYCSVSGYGAKGPLRNKAGYDAMVAAYSGVFALTGEADRPPVRPGVAAIDMSTGMLAYGGVVSALLARERGAGGQRVDVSLLESGVSLLSYHGVAWTAGGVRPEREGAGFSTISPYGVYRARNGDILIGAPSQPMWLKACGVLNAPELADDPRYASNVERCRHDDDLRKDLESRLASDDVDTWIGRFEAAGVANAPMNTLEQVFQDEQVLANDMVVPAKRPDGTTVDLLGLPFKLSGTPGTPGDAPPETGQHNESVFAEFLGLSAADVKALKDDGAI